MKKNEGDFQKTFYDVERDRQDPNYWWQSYEEEVRARNDPNLNKYFEAGDKCTNENRRAQGDLARAGIKTRDFAAEPSDLGSDSSSSKDKNKDKDKAEGKETAK